MKKYILIIFLILIIGCSLDTFDSDNLASWHINLDLPLFKTNYTYADLLKDYEELEIEQYENTSDSIYVFNALTPHYVDVSEHTIKKDGDDVLPEIVTVPNYEIEIPTLPDELDGINFIDVDLYLQVDLSQFRTDLADSIMVNNIIINGSNGDGITRTAEINNQMIWQDGQILNDGKLIIDDPEDLINIRPDIVELSGYITVYPTDNEGEQLGQVITLISILHAPLILEITETSTFTPSPDKVKAEVDDQVFEVMTLYIEIDNQMEIGGNINMLVSPDTINFEENPPIPPDTLLSLQLLPDQFQTKTVILNDEKINLLADSTYIQTSLKFIGTTDAQGNPAPTRFLTNDSLNILLYSSSEILIDPQNMGEE